MPQVSITRLRLRSIRFLPAFFWYTYLSLRQARGTAGCLDVRIRQHEKAYWTLTGWRDSAARSAFMLAGPHRKVMPKLANWCDEASLAHWDQASEALPSWQEATQQLERCGRTSRVDHPSPAQALAWPLGTRRFYEFTVSLEKDEISVMRVDGVIQRTRIADLRRVLVETNDSGPWGDDVWWVLEGPEADRWVSFPLGTTGEKPVIDRLKQLPGFQVRGMNSTANAQFECWPNPAP